MDIEDLRKRVRFTQSDKTNFNEFFRDCMEQSIARISTDKKVSQKERRELSNQLVDACLIEFENRMSKSTDKPTDTKKYVPAEMRTKHDERGNVIPCECCRYPATRTRFDPSNSVTHYFCDWHTLMCRKKLSREKIEELNLQKELKERPYLNWLDERKLDSGIYCNECFKKTGELVEIVRGTCRCPRCGDK